MEQREDESLLERYETTEVFEEMLLLKMSEFYHTHKDLRYVWGGRSPHSIEEKTHDPFCPQFKRYKKEPKGALTSDLKMDPGFDCAGFIRYFFSENNFESFKTNRRTAEYLDENNLVHIGKLDHSSIYEHVHKAKIFDLIFFGYDHEEEINWNHVGIYLGNGEIIHCSRVKNEVHCALSEIEIWKSLDLEYPDLKYRGGINITHISSYETPEWEKPNTHWAIVKIYETQN